MIRHTQPTCPGLDPPVVLGAIRRVLGVTPEEIAGPLRAHRIVQAREIAVSLMRMYSNLSYLEISRCVLGSDSHSASLYAERRCEKERSWSPTYRDTWERVRRELEFEMRKNKSGIPSFRPARRLRKTENR